MKRRIFCTVWAGILVLGLNLTAFAADFLIPVGKVVGLSLSEGTVTVVAYDDALGAGARDAGLQIGDEIVSVNRKPVDSGEDLHRALAETCPNVELELRRNGKPLTLTLEPNITREGPMLGVYVREGISGIGTVTYYNPETGSFGALGHGISGPDGEPAPMRTGNLYPASVTGIRPGEPGKPGQLQGAVDPEHVIGRLSRNSRAGVFGTCEPCPGERLAVAAGDQVRVGEATILCNLSGDRVEEFPVEIVKINHNSGNTGRDLVLKVRDPGLLEQTGGIVAGMSGSPIIQNGKLVGAVTHVLVNDPTRGYGIFIETMLASRE